MCDTGKFPLNGDCVACTHSLGCIECSSETGICSKCIDGLYPDSEGHCVGCENVAGCTSECNSQTGECSKCKIEFYLDNK